MKLNQEASVNNDSKEKSTSIKKSNKKFVPKSIYSYNSNNSHKPELNSPNTQLPKIENDLDLNRSVYKKSEKETKISRLVNCNVSLLKENIELKAKILDIAKNGNLKELSNSKFTKSYKKNEFDNMKLNTNFNSENSFKKINVITYSKNELTSLNPKLLNSINLITDSKSQSHNTNIRYISKVSGLSKFKITNKRYVLDNSNENIENNLSLNNKMMKYKLTNNREEEIEKKGKESLFQNNTNSKFSKFGVINQIRKDLRIKTLKLIKIKTSARSIDNRVVYS
jgi:hypothetical protein